MKDSIKNRKKKVLALCLSVMMFSSITALAACKDTGSSTDSSSSSTSVTEQVKDDGLIKNARFETFDEDNVINTSVSGWTRSTTSIAGSSALSSKAASGIVDLNDSAWRNLTESKVNVTNLTVAEARQKWSWMSVKDKLTYYDLWKEKNPNKKIAEELDFYESFNIDSGDIPTVENPETHNGDVAANKAEGTSKRSTKVLMIHNEYPEGSTGTYKALGTGQQYTSASTVTVKAGTSAELSVWVKTANLECSDSYGNPHEAVDKGAFISITHSVGGKTMDAYKVENINTERMELTNPYGWKKYIFYLKGSSYTDTTFNLVLGLGQGSMTNRGDYVNGYAFFDDITCKTISNESYNYEIKYWQQDEHKELDAAHIATFDSDEAAKTIDASKTDNMVYAMDFYGSFNPLAEEKLNSIAAEATNTEINGVKMSVESNPADAAMQTAPWLKGGKDGSKDVAKLFANADEIANGTGVNDAQKAELAKLYAKYFEQDATFDEEKTLLLMSVDGVPYTAKMTETIKFSDYSSKYLAVSFFVKTSKMAGYTGAGVTLVEGNNKTAFTAIDTTTAEAVEVGEEKLYGDWQQYIFFVEDESENDKADFGFNLEFNFGPTSVEIDTKLDSYYAGFAAFTNFQVLPLSKVQFDSAQSGTYAKIVSLNNDPEAQKDTNGDPFDSAMGTPSDALEKGIAIPQNYIGTTFDSLYVTGTGTTADVENDNAGLIAKEHFTAEDGYFTSNTDAWFTAIKGEAEAAGKTTAKDAWNYAFGNSTQPLLIYTDAEAAAKAAYGYIGKSTELAANTYTAISVRVRGTGNAYIRLVDTNASNYDDFKAYNKPLSIGANRTYWYNSDGNVCTGDPEEKATQVAFKLQTNGLYKANKSGWDGYEALAEKDAWYANLSAYTQKDEKGNLLVAEGGAKHDYNDYWNNAGMNGIAFYYDKTNDRYCADEALQIPVIDFKEVAGLSPRTEAVAASGNELEAELTLGKNSAGEYEWQTVTFYVHTGDVAKNYRLEVWSGNKAGESNDDGSFLVFDYNNPGTAETNFTGLLEEYEDKATAKFESVFSYYDTASYLRYNKDLDENKIGDLYKDNYSPIAQTEGIAFLRYVEEGKRVTVMADYQYSEKTVTAKAVEDEKEEEDATTDENPADTNIWLLISSLAIAGVLLLAIGSIVIRKVIVKARKNRVANGGNKSKK